MASPFHQREYDIQAAERFGAKSATQCEQEAYCGQYRLLGTSLEFLNSSWAPTELEVCFCHIPGGYQAQTSVSPTGLSTVFFVNRACVVSFVTECRGRDVLLK